MIQTFGSTINFHPHVHALVSRGGWTEGGQWVPLPWVDAKAAELLFRHKVLSLLRKAGLIDEQRMALLLSWKHTGFSVHNSVSVQPEDAGATERLVRYLMRAPVSQERLETRPALSTASIVRPNPTRSGSTLTSTRRSTSAAPTSTPRTLCCAKGLPVEAPMVTHYGMKQLYLRDPDGYNLCFQWPA
ncbi:MAG TPA: transposase [Thermoanaerobaculia bacterium]|nr:transposase [Thermoanaerobaculia bacterium]